MAPGVFLRTDRVKTFLRGAGGAIDFIVLNKGFGLLLEQGVGQNTITGGSADKTHTIIPDASALQGKSMTLQVGRPDVGGTVRAFTFEGGKILGGELKCDVDGPLHYIPTFDFDNVLTATALASASYPATQEMFVFSEGAVTLGGTTIYAKSMSVKWANNLKTDRRNIGNVKREPVANNWMEVTVDLDCELEDLTQYAAWLAGTQATFLATFTLATVIPTTATPFSFTIRIEKCELMGDTPKVGGPDVVRMPLKLRGLYDGTNPILKLVYVTSDTVS